MEKRDKEGGVSRSFKTGAIALVFLIIGFQTAIFLHRAAVMKIEAGHDVPDTVFVYIDANSRSAATNNAARAANSGQPQGKVVKIERKNAQHTERVQKAREQYVKKTVENFRFNPNTATTEELVRLGFSPKQAQSIDNYRKKGGKFSRKEDFAKSFVVADSVYRRLEPYIDIPKTDLNQADSAAFDALPGIGPFYAAKIVEYRKELGGYSSKEQLLNIWKFDQNKLDAIQDLIFIRPETVRPYELWTLPVDSLRKHPHIRNWNTARNIVLYRENSPKEEWTIKALRENGIITDDQATALSRCLIAEP